MQIPEKGDLVYMNFSPQLGSEQAGVRPAIILSPKLFNNGKFLVVCPITSQIKNYPFEVELPDNLVIRGVVLTDQVRTVDWRTRKLNVKGQAPEEVIETCIKRIQTFLYI